MHPYKLTKLVHKGDFVVEHWRNEDEPGPEENGLPSAMKTAMKRPMKAMKAKEPPKSKSMKAKELPKSMAKKLPNSKAKGAPTKNHKKMTPFKRPSKSTTSKS